MAMLNVDNINVYYGAIHAGQNVSLSVKEGEIVTEKPKRTRKAPAKKAAPKKTAAKKATEKKK